PKTQSCRDHRFAAQKEKARTEEYLSPGFIKEEDNLRRMEQLVNPKYYSGLDPLVSDCQDNINQVRYRVPNSGVSLVPQDIDLQKLYLAQDKVYKELQASELA